MQLKGHFKDSARNGAQRLVVRVYGLGYLTHVVCAIAELTEVASGRGSEVDVGSPVDCCPRAGKAL